MFRVFMMKSMMMCAWLLCGSVLLAPPKQQDRRAMERKFALQDKLVARDEKSGNITGALARITVQIEEQKLRSQESMKALEQRVQDSSAKSDKGVKSRVAAVAQRVAQMSPN